MLLLSAAVLSCSKDEEVKKKGDADLPHNGTKWNIVSVDQYVLSEVGVAGVVNKTGNAGSIGAFYFDEAESKGSFEMTIEGYNKEDVFSFTQDGDDITIVSIDQSVGVTTNQNILVITGSKTSETEITLTSFSVLKESSSTGIFSLTATSVKLVKA
jgi:hypothetical protein